MKNLVILIGRIASQPQTRHAGETTITSFTLVTDRPKLVDGKTVKNEAGYTETLAEFHRRPLPAVARGPLRRLLTGALPGAVGPDRGRMGAQAQ